MSHFLCRCGFDVRNISAPSAHEGYLVTNIDMDDGSLKTVSDIIRLREVLECPMCLRIYIQRDPRGPYLPFIAEGEALHLAEQQGGYRG